MGLFDSILGDMNPASVLGNVASAYGTWRQAAMGRDFSAYQADIQRGREDTAHQREVADLKAAGLNPILTATGGSGLGAGGAPTASGVTMPDIFTSSVNTGLAAKQNKASVDNLVQAVNASKASQAAAEAQTENYKAQLDGFSAQSQRYQSEAGIAANEKVKSDLATELYRRALEEMKKAGKPLDFVLEGLTAPAASTVLPSAKAIRENPKLDPHISTPSFWEGLKYLGNYFLNPSSALKSKIMNSK